MRRSGRCTWIAGCLLLFLLSFGVVAPVAGIDAHPLQHAPLMMTDVAFGEDTPYGAQLEVVLPPLPSLTTGPIHAEASVRNVLDFLASIFQPPEHA
jgi:hypothetical protein